MWKKLNTLWRARVAALFLQFSIGAGRLDMSHNKRHNQLALRMAWQDYDMHSCAHQWSVLYCKNGRIKSQRTLFAFFSGLRLRKKQFITAARLFSLTYPFRGVAIVAALTRQWPLFAVWNSAGVRTYTYTYTYTPTHPPTPHNNDNEFWRSVKT